MLDILKVKTMSRTDLAALGMDQVAYVRRIQIQGEEMFAIMAADGRQLGLAPDYDSAASAVDQHELGLVSVH